MVKFYKSKAMIIKKKVVTKKDDKKGNSSVTITEETRQVIGHWDGKDQKTGRRFIVPRFSDGSEGKPIYF